MSVKNPEALENLNEQKITDELREYVNLHHKNVLEAMSDKEQWDQRDVEYFKKRFGIRTKATFPWPGASNFVLPLIDANISKQKPHYLNLAKASPIVTFEPFGPEDVDAARKRERLYDWRIKNKMDFMRPYAIGIDKCLSSGFVVFKIVWAFETGNYTIEIDLNELPEEVMGALLDPRLTDDGVFQIFVEEYKPDLNFDENVEAIKKAVRKFREGETEFRVLLTEKIKDTVEIEVCDPRTDIIVPKDTLFLEDARFIAYPFWVTKNDLKIAMRDGKYNEFDDETIQAWAGKGRQDTTGGTAMKGFVHGVNQDDAPSDELILLWETCLYYDINGDGIKERCLATYPDADTEAVLRFIELPYDHGKWPYVQVRRELIDTGYFSARGIPALDCDFQDGISTSFNQSINAQTITNAPMLFIRKNSGVNPRNIRFVPGESHVVENPAADVSLLQTPNLNQGNFIETQRILKTWSQERLGQVQFGDAGQNNRMGQRSATEISIASQFQDVSVSFDLQIFQLQMGRVHEQIDALFEQFGSEEEHILMTGEKPEKVTRKEVRGKFNVVPNGRFDNTNPVLRQQVAFQNLQAGINDPWVNQYELRKDYYDAQNPTTTKRLVKTPEQMGQEQLAAKEAELKLLQQQLGAERFKSELKNRETILKTDVETTKEVTLKRMDMRMKEMEIKSKERIDAKRNKAIQNNGDGRQ